MQTTTQEKLSYSRPQVSLLVILRVLIGWHFFYEGMAKALNPAWSAKAYLLDSKGFLSELFVNMASSPATLEVINFLNVYGLILIGLGLILGCFTRVAAISGIALLSLYYLSHPPLPHIKYMLPSSGNYFIVDSLLIEIFAIAVLLVFPTGKIIGLDRLIFRAWRNEKAE